LHGISLHDAAGAADQLREGMAMLAFYAGLWLLSGR